MDPNANLKEQLRLAIEIPTLEGLRTRHGTGNQEQASETRSKAEGRLRGRTRGGDSSPKGRRVWP